MKELFDDGVLEWGVMEIIRVQVGDIVVVKNFVGELRYWISVGGVCRRGWTWDVRRRDMVGFEPLRICKVSRRGPFSSRRHMFAVKPVKASVENFFLFFFLYKKYL